MRVDRVMRVGAPGLVNPGAFHMVLGVKLGVKGRGKSLKTPANKGFSGYGSTGAVPVRYALFTPEKARKYGVFASASDALTPTIIHA